MSTRVSQLGLGDAHLCMRCLTDTQELVLWTIAKHGPITVSDLSYHLLMDESSARNIADRLERKGLVGRAYSQRQTNRSGRRARHAYVITDVGDDLLGEEDDDG